MKSNNNHAVKFWSYKLGRPESLKSHRTMDAAKKRAADYGLVYCPDSHDVFQAFKLSNGDVGAYSIAHSPSMCTVTVDDYDLIGLLEEKGHIAAQVKLPQYFVCDKGHIHSINAIEGKGIESLPEMSYKVEKGTYGYNVLLGYEDGDGGFPVDYEYQLWDSREALEDTLNKALD